MFAVSSSFLPLSLGIYTRVLRSVYEPKERRGSWIVAERGRTGTKFKLLIGDLSVPNVYLASTGVFTAVPLLLPAIHSLWRPIRLSIRVNTQSPLPDRSSTCERVIVCGARCRIHRGPRRGRGNRSVLRGFSSFYWAFALSIPSTQFFSIPRPNFDDLNFDFNDPS